MGGCASRPKEFDAAAVPEQAEAPEKVVAAQEGGEVEKEEAKEAPLVDLSEPVAAEEGEKKEEEEEKKKEEEKAEDAEAATAAPSS